MTSEQKRVSKNKKVKAVKTAKPERAKIAKAPKVTPVKAKASVVSEAGLVEVRPQNQAPQDQATEWVELFPSGIAIATDMGRPILIMKDKTGENVQPVWMNPLDAGVALSGMQDTTGQSPHALSRKILDAMGVKIDTCTFVELIGHHQYVQIQLRPSGPEAREAGISVKVRAEEAMSLCLQAGARFFSTKDYMTRCLRINAELGSLEQSLAKGELVGLQNELETVSKKHPYVM